MIQNEPYNLKVNTRGIKLAYQEPIKITYSRTQRTVRFTSKEFDYSQSGLPQGVEFAVAIGLGSESQKVEVELIHVDGEK